MNNYIKEKCFISKLLGISQRRIEIDDQHPCPETIIFIDGTYHGYLDQEFYNFMEYGLDPDGYFKDWIDEWGETHHAKPNNLSVDDAFDLVYARYADTFEKLSEE